MGPGPWGNLSLVEQRWRRSSILKKRMHALPACLPPACVLLLAAVRLDLAFFPEFVRGLDAAADGLDRRRLLARLRTKPGQAAIGEREREG